VRPNREQERRPSIDVRGKRVRDVNVSHNRVPSIRVAAEEALEKVRVRWNRMSTNSDESTNWVAWASLIVGVLGLAAAIIVPLVLA